MNKIVLISIVSLMLTLLSFNESNAQCDSCPINSTPANVNLNLGGGCIVTIHYCMFCHPTGHPEAKLCGVYIPVSCGTINIDLDFWTKVRNEMIKDLALKCSYSGQIGPCPQRAAFSIYQAFCMGVYPNNPQNPTEYIIKPCDGEAGECYKEYEVCYQGTELIITVVNSQTTPGACDFMEFEFDPLNPPYYCFSACP